MTVGLGVMTHISRRDFEVRKKGFAGVEGCVSHFEVENNTFVDKLELHTGTACGIGNKTGEK